jgi:hypothetical protein
MLTAADVALILTACRPPKPIIALVDSLVPHLIAMADRISARLGYHGDDETPYARPLPTPAPEGLIAV